MTRRPRSTNKSRTRSKERYFTKEDQFLSRMASILMRSKFDTKNLFNQRASTVIRLNPLAGDVKEIKNLLLSMGIELKEVDWSPNTYIVEGQDKSDLGELKEYERGLYYIQNLSSMLPVVELDPQKDEEILDMCAAPGSKTTMICAMTENKGLVTANEEDYRRLSKLQNVLRQFHCKNVTITQNDGRDIGRLSPDHYDKILLDAPCSGEGLIYLRSEKPLRFWNIKKVKVMAKIQRELILSAYDALKTGGTLIYSTCTLEPEENEGVISFLLNKRKNAAIRPLQLLSHASFQQHRNNVVRGITKWSGNIYESDVKMCMRVIPSSDMQGFFVAKIIKP
jgi:NOL1/NOP2/sun family putative RNA methylase